MKRSAFLRTVLAATLAGFIDVRNLMPEEVFDAEAFGTSVMGELADINEIWGRVQQRVLDAFAETSPEFAFFAEPPTTDAIFPVDLG